MLQSIREHLTGWIAGFIITLLVIPFAFWGINDYFHLAGDTYVAKVNDQEISAGQLRQAYEQRYAQLRQMFGDRFDPSMIDTDQLRKEMLDQMINRAVLEQHVREMGYHVGNQQLLDAIRQIPAFQQDGKFSSDLYKARLATQRMSPAQFEASYRGSLALNQIQQSVVSSAFVTNSQFAEAIRLRKQERKVSYVAVKADRFAKDVSLNDADIQAYYDAHSKQYMTPEKVTLGYLELSGDSLAAGMNVDEAKLKKRYQAEVKKLQGQEQRKARHILLSVPSDATDQTWKDTRAKADDLIKQLKGGADFAALAKKYSDDPGSAKKGGELGWVDAGTMVKPFDKALFDLKKGEISKPVRTRYGIHIIQLEDVRKPKVPSFAEEKDKLAKEMLKSEVDDAYYDKAEKLTDLTYTNPQSLQPAADQLNLKIQQVSGVTRDSGDGIASNAKVRKAAFSSDVLKDGQNSDPVELGHNHVVVIRVLDHTAATQKPLSAVRDQVVSALTQEKAMQAAQKAAQKLVADAGDQGDLAAAAKADGFSATEPKFLAHGAQAVPAGLMQAVFAAPRPKGSPYLGTTQLQDGYAAFTITDVKAGDPATLTAAERKSMRGGMTRRAGSSQFGAYVAELRRQAEVDINQDVLNQQ